ncbi:hypothetical protein LTR16_002476 [Cryomyces antarcticus]|uniref:Uncharacterized protein n=1 Tax=Cryomyces antarcticus TaxID=329879 RepID=A0ABR0LRJ7_9PEZI|nr:hypothetical protein LTR60_002931 [Cryomyces antarcticus]KAK5015859.1 hypothetical protein LTR39_002387 [Cryomyces antarcticus]KAK5201496.1 hypothetical protein LTR16_002476 [Cryomyces antarcticus]
MAEQQKRQLRARGPLTVPVRSTTSSYMYTESSESRGDLPFEIGKKRSRKDEVKTFNSSHIPSSFLNTELMERKVVTLKGQVKWPDRI